MTLHVSQRPGRQERHLLRKRHNPLFPESEREPSSAALTEAQRLDHEELSDFIGSFRGLVLETTNLQSNEDSAVILGIKERLEQGYEQASGLADNQSDTLDAITRLLDIIHRAIRRGAAGDDSALARLEQENQARQLHFQLLEYPLVADLLAPTSPIKPDELAATLLSAETAEYQAALSLFDNNQWVLLYQQGCELLDRSPDAPDQVVEHLAMLKQQIGQTL
ncbi:MAG: hypothetical protein KDI63_09055 [Gammaproteobacteria bacterium]|nr:hypothetical protein [Gammaproteobacteria bacterium]